MNNASLGQHLVFAALLIPTLIVSAAAVVSLATAQPLVLQPAIQVIACRVCPGPDDDLY